MSPEGGEGGVDSPPPSLAPGVKRVADLSPDSAAAAVLDAAGVSVGASIHSVLAGLQRPATAPAPAAPLADTPTYFHEEDDDGAAGAFEFAP